MRARARQEPATTHSSATHSAYRRVQRFLRALFSYNFNYCVSFISSVLNYSIEFPFSSLFACLHIILVHANVQ